MPPESAKKVRYFEDPEMKGRILPPPALTPPARRQAEEARPPRVTEIGMTP